MLHTTEDFCVVKDPGTCLQVERTLLAHTAGEDEAK